MGSSHHPILYHHQTQAQVWSCKEMYHCCPIPCQPASCTMGCVGFWPHSMLETAVKGMQMAEAFLSSAYLLSERPSPVVGMVSSGREGRGSGPEQAGAAPARLQV